MFGLRSTGHGSTGSFKASFLAGTALVGSFAVQAPTMADAATLDLAGASKSLPQAGFFNNQAYVNGAADNVTNNGGATAVLTEGGGVQGTAYAGTVADGASRTGLTHTGGSVLLLGPNTFSGGLLITGGTVIAGANQTLGATTNGVTVTGGALGTGASTQQISTLALSGTGLVTVNKGGILGAGAITVAPGLASLLTAPGGAIAGPLTNGGLVANAGLWNGPVIANTGSIGNAGLWTGSVVSNNGNIGNVAQWSGAIVSNSGNIGNNGAWIGAVNNGVLGNVYTADSSVITGAVANAGRIFGYGGTVNGDIVNSGSLFAPGSGSIDPGIFGPAIAAAAAGTLNGNGSVTIHGGLTNTATGYASVSQGATLSLDGTLANQASGQVYNAGRINAVLVNAGAVENDSAGTWTGAATNSGFLENRGTWTGDVTNDAGGAIFASGRFAGSVTNNGAFAFNGGQVGGNLVNNGTLVSTRGAVGLALTNAGTIDLTSGGATSNTITAAQYVSQAGARASALVDLGTGATGGTATRFNFAAINGAAPTQLTLTNTAAGIGYYPSIVVVPGDTTNVFQVTPASLAQLQRGFVAYDFADGTLSGKINPAKASTAGIQVASIVTVLNSDFFQDWQPFITAPQDPDANSVSGGPWIRGKYGNETIDSTAAQVGRAGVASRVATEFSGFQVGGDVGLFNINKTGWNLIGGITGGEVFATSREKLAGSIKGVFEIPFVGAYAALTNGPFHADFLYRHDFYGLSLTDAADGLGSQGLQANGDSYNFDAGYSIALGTFGTLGNVFIEPNGSLIVSKVSINPLDFKTLGLGTLSFSDVDSLLGRGGFRLGTSLVVDKVALQPFMTAAVWHEFEDNARSSFQPTAGFGAALDAVPLTVTRVGTFGQFGVGLNGELLGQNILGTLRADFRVGDKIDGQSVTGQLRYQF